MNLRDKFIKDFASITNERSDITLYHKFADIQESPLTPHQTPHPIYAEGYQQGIRDGITSIMSLTDSREENGAEYRLTNKAGEIITFYPDDNLGGDPTVDADGNQVFVKGLIAELFDKVSS